MRVHMREEEFIGEVSRRAQLDVERAKQLTHATLRTLAQRVGGDATWRLRHQLPPELGAETLNGPGEPFAAAEFAKRVAAKTDLPEDEVREDIPAVFDVLADAADDRALHDCYAKLDTGCRRLAGAAS